MLASLAIAALLGGLIGLSNRLGALLFVLALLLLGGNYFSIPWIELIIFISIAQMSYLGCSFLQHYATTDASQRLGRDSKAGRSLS